MSPMLLSELQWTGSSLHLKMQLHGVFIVLFLFSQLIFCKTEKCGTDDILLNLNHIILSF